MLRASNDIKEKKGVNHLRRHLTRGCVFIYLSVNFPPRKCTFASLSTIRHNTNNPCNHWRPLVAIKSQWFNCGLFRRGVVLQPSSPYRPSFHQEALVNITRVNKVYCGHCDPKVQFGV